MVVDGVNADEQLGAYLPVRAVVGCEVCDLYFLRSEVSDGLDRPLAHGLSSRSQLAACPIGEGLHPDGAQQLVRGPQVFTGVGPSLLPPQPLAVDEIGPSKLGAKLRTSEPVDGLQVEGPAASSLLSSAREWA